MKRKFKSMIQDRLTAKFQSAKPTQHRQASATPKPKPVAKAKASKPATDRFIQGRQISGSFWL